MRTTKVLCAWAGALSVAALLGACGQAFTTASSTTASSSSGGAAGGAGAGGGSSASSAGGAGGDSSVSTATATTTTTATTTASTSSGGGDEDCTNFADDDNDGLTDCEDPDCQAYTCAPNAPPGWDGPVALWKGAPGAPLDCPEGFQSGTTGGTELDASPASCMCSCGAPSGGNCGPATIQLFAVDDCGGASYAVPLGTPGTCTTINFPLSASGKASPLPVQGGSCSPMPAQVTPDWSFSEVGQTCAPTDAGGGCLPQESCVARPPPDFAHGLCVERSGDHPCPPLFSQKTVLYAGGDDTRGCTACTCGAPTGASCAAGTKLFFDNLCAQTVASFTNDGTCQDIPIDQVIGSFLVTASSGPSGGACAASQPQATGGVTPTGATTICCLP